MKPRLLLTLGIGALALALAFIFVLVELWPNTSPAPAEMFAYQRQTRGELPELWQVPSFAFKDQHGKSATERDLLGQVSIADFIYTSCTNVCPMISAKRALLERKLAGAPLRFVSFSVDPEHDTPEVLARYARTWGSDPRWTLVNTDREGLAAFASGMRVAVDPTNDPQNPILHSNMFLLIDTRGSVRGVYDSADREALERLVSDAKALLDSASVAATASDTGDGEALFTSLGCAACHNDDRIAPPLHGLLGKTRNMVGGAQVTADSAYLKDSIVAPGSKVVAGFLNLMPAYAHDLSDAQIASLVDYIQKLPAKAEAATSLNQATAAEAPAIDPVCKMNVRISASTPHAAVGGHDYYFCSEPCRDRFTKNPSQYLSSTGP